MEARIKTFRHVEIPRPEIDVESLIPKSVFTAGVTDCNTDWIEDTLTDTEGMDDMPEGIFNDLVAHLLSKGKIRDAMLLTIHANIGARHSDVSRIRLIEVLTTDRHFRDSIAFTEKKTSKTRNYYINDAMKIAIAAYLSHNPQKTLMDYLVVSEANRKTYEEVIFGGKTYVVQSPLSRIQEERCIKDNLAEIGVMLRNDSRYKGGELKLNTHSLRKLYVEKFCETAYRLKHDGLIDIDTQIISLAQIDLAHTDVSTTLRYSKRFEKYKRAVVNEMNMGLSIWKNYVKGALA